MRKHLPPTSAPMGGTLDRTECRLWAASTGLAVSPSWLRVIGPGCLLRRRSAKCRCRVGGGVVDHQHTGFWADDSFLESLVHEEAAVSGPRHAGSPRIQAVSGDLREELTGHGWNSGPHRRSCAIGRPPRTAEEFAVLEPLEEEGVGVIEARERAALLTIRRQDEIRALPSCLTAIPTCRLDSWQSSGRRTRSLSQRRQRRREPIRSRPVLLRSVLRCPRTTLLPSPLGTSLPTRLCCPNASTSPKVRPRPRNPSDIPGRRTGGVSGRRTARRHPR